MADVWASDAVKIIRCLRCHEKKVNEVVDQVMLLVSELRSTHSNSLLNHPSQIEYHEGLFRLVAHEFEDVLETFVVDHTKNEGKFIKRFFRTFFSALDDCFVLKHIKQNIAFQRSVIDLIKKKKKTPASAKKNYRYR